MGDPFKCNKKYEIIIGTWLLLKYISSALKRGKMFIDIPKKGLFKELFNHNQIIFSSSRLIFKNPAYGRQSISQPMRIVAPIPKKYCW